MPQMINPETGDTIHTQAIVDFYMDAVQDDLATLKEGRPIFKEEERIRIRFAGNTKTEFHAPASDRSDRPFRNRDDNTRVYPTWKDHPDFKPTYDAFKRGQEYAVNGTPIEEAPFLTMAQRKEMKAINIHTVEALANLDPQTKTGGGLGDFRRKAQVYLERAAGSAVDARHEQQVKSMQDELAQLRMQMEMMSTGNAAPAAKPKPTAAKASTAGPSPFETWEDADIRNWIKDAAPDDPAPHNRCSHATLVKMASDINARLRAANHQVAA